MALFKKISLFLIGISLSIHSNAQTDSDVIESSLSAVVTVAVYETKITKKTLGFRGDNSIDLAYAKMLDLSGAKGSGSGFIIKYGNQLYVVTNAHVIESASDIDSSIIVYSIDRSKYHMKLVGGDSFYDFAILKFLDKPGSELGYLDFSVISPKIGDRVYAIGNPLGEYPYSVSDGIISAKNRLRGGLTGKFGFLQTTATVIWGNSGGPLIDSKGKVVGINSQIAFANKGDEAIWQPQINFSLEAPIALKLMRDILENNGIVKRAYLGVEIKFEKPIYSPDSDEYYFYKNKLSLNQYPTLSNVDTLGPAKFMSKYIGSQIMSINGENVRNLDEVLGVFEKTIPGQIVKFSLLWNGKISSFEILSSKLTTFETSKIGKNLFSDVGMPLIFDDGYVETVLDESTVAHNLFGLGNLSSEKATKSNARMRFSILGIGILDGGHESLWRIKDLADVGSSVRLTSQSGILDIILFRIGGDPESEGNYLKKRINFSNSDFFKRYIIYY